MNCFTMSDGRHTTILKVPDRGIFWLYLILTREFPASSFFTPKESEWSVIVLHLIIFLSQRDPKGLVLSRRDTVTPRVSVIEHTEVCIWNYFSPEPFNHRIHTLTTFMVWRDTPFFILCVEINKSVFFVWGFL